MTDIGQWVETWRGLGVGDSPALRRLHGVEAANEFLASDIFAENPVGVPFDPDRMVELLAAGVSVTELKKQGAAQGNNLAGTSLVKEDFADVPAREWKTT